MGKFLLLVSGSLLLNLAAGFNTRGFGERSARSQSTLLATSDSSRQVSRFYWPVTSPPNDLQKQSNP